MTYRSEEGTLLSNDEYEVVHFTRSGAIVYNKRGKQLFVPSSHYKVERDGIN